MNWMDKQYKAFFNSNERFSDMINGSIFNGKQVLSADELVELDTELNEELNKERVVQRRRDLLKKYGRNSSEEVIVGIELQSSPDKDMVIRMMEYDAMVYLHQKARPLIPVISAVLYCGEKEWIQPSSLYNQMRFAEWMRDYVQDYRFHFVELLKVNVNNFKNEEIREFIELFQDVHLLNREQFLNKYEDKVLKSAEAVNAVAVLGKCKELSKIITQDKEGNLMCRNFDRIINEIRTEGHMAGKTEGLLEGKAKGILEGVNKGVEKERLNTIERLYLKNASIDMISCACGLNKEDVLKIIRERGLVYTG
jgi:predicted transposase/invertase (TIGR01784 family)